MPTLEHNGSKFEVDEDGFLLNAKEFDQNWVDYVKVLGHRRDDR